MSNLSPKHRRFVAEYLKDQNSTQAAIRSGYSAKNADVVGPRLLGNVGVRAAIDAALATITQKAEVTKERILKALLNVAELDPRKLYNSDGTMKAISELPDEVALAIASMESDDSDGEIKKMKFCDKVKALELLGKHVKLFEEVSPLNGVPMVINIVPAHNPNAPDPGH